MPFAEIVPAWLNLRRGAPEACNVFFGLQYARPTYTEARLLLVAIVAESLQKGLARPSNERPRERMHYRDRLRDLAGRPDEEARRALVPEVDAWVGDLVDARNTLAHTGNDYDADRDIFVLEWVTSSLITLALMAELGMATDVQLRAATTVLKPPWG